MKNGVISMDNTQKLQAAIMISAKAQTSLLAWMQESTFDEVLSGMTYDPEGLLEADIGAAIDTLQTDLGWDGLSSEDAEAIVDLARELYKPIVDEIENHYVGIQSKRNRKLLMDFLGDVRDDYWEVVRDSTAEARRDGDEVAWTEDEISTIRKELVALIGRLEDGEDA